MSTVPSDGPLDPYVFGKEQRCFGCGPHNPTGLQLKFRKEGDEVVTTYTPAQGYQGPPNVFHGGLQATLADEVAGWGLVGLLGRMGFTTSLQMRYVRPMLVGQEIEARASVASQTGSFVTLNVRLIQQGKTGAMGRVTYMLPDRDKAKDYLGGDMPEDWKRLFE